MSNSRNIILLLSGLLLSCQEVVENHIPEVKPASKKASFLSAIPGEKTSRATLQLMATAVGQPTVAELLKYDVQTYILHYTTPYKGEMVEASGVIMVPIDMTHEPSLVSFQHGTIFSNDDAPSMRGGFQGVEFFASAGYVTLMPDYLGYGASASIFHPYYDKRHAASSVIDMIYAAREFLEREKVSINNKLFLGGYSEGGYVTLAAAREIDAHPEYGLHVTGVAAGAGGYDLTHMMETVTEKTHYAYPAYLSFLLMAYNHTNEWHQPLDYFFKKSYSDALQKYMNGDYSGSYINGRLTSHIPTLFNADFYAGLKRADGALELKSALLENSVIGWRTKIPIRLYHGTQDQIIPYDNSQVTLRQFKAAGSNHVTLTLLPGGTHGNSFERMLRDFIPWFLAL